MANPLEIELKLKLANLRTEAKKAGQEINSGLATSPKEFFAAQGQRARIERAQRNRKLDEADAAKEAKAQKLLAAKEQKAKMLASAKNLAMATAGIVAAFKVLKKTLSEMIQTADAARRTYAKILQSGGMASGFIIQRQQLAEVLGVGENEVMQYGKAIANLNSRLQFSRSVLTETNPTLTEVGWQFKVLNQDMKALWAQLTYEAAPALTTFAMSLSGLVRGATMLLPIMMPVLTLLAKLMPKAPSVPVSINRLPGSNWEKMGMVIGRVGAQDYTKKTSENTAKVVTLLEKFAHNYSHLQKWQNDNFSNPNVSYP
jgi:hypothetical protein